MARNGCVRPEAAGMWWLVDLLGRRAARQTAGGVASWFMCLDAVVVATSWCGSSSERRVIGARLDLVHGGYSGGGDGGDGSGGRL